MYDQVRLKPASKADETPWNLEISAIASTRRYYTIQAENNKGADRTARMPSLICAFVVGI